MTAHSLLLPPQAPLMVLPGVSLFPHALLPIYIFEPRYRAMLAHCLENDRIFCIAMVKSGISEATRPEHFFDIAGCGLVRACVGNPDGTSNLILQGLTRVRFTGFTQEKPFRVAKIVELESEGADTVESEALGAKVIELCRQLKDGGFQPSAQLDTFLAHLTNLDMLADLVAHTFVTDPFRRQALLEQSLVPARLRLLIQYLSDDLQ